MERLLGILRKILVRKIADCAKRLVGEADGTQNRHMVLYLLSRELFAMGTDCAPILLREIIVQASRRIPGYAEYLRHVGDIRTLAAHTGNPFMSAILQKSRRLQFDEVVELLTETPPKRRIYHTEEVESYGPTQEYMPLGVRKSLARRPSPSAIEGLLYEQDPQVVRNLLSNPRTVEEMVVKMASMRPTSAAVLEEIFGHRKWAARYSVRKALVFNPYSPPRISHAILPSLLMKDLLDVSLSPTLHENLPVAARRFILHRMGEMSVTERRQFSERYSKVLKRIFVQVG